MAAMAASSSASQSSAAATSEVQVFRPADESSKREWIFQLSPPGRRSLAPPSRQFRRLALVAGYNIA